MFDFNEILEEDITVTLDGIPATITEQFGQTVGFSSNMYIRIAEDVDPGTVILVTITSVINQPTAGEYSVYAFGTTNAAATLVDTPEGEFIYTLVEEEIILDGEGTLEDPYQLTQCFTITESGYYELQNNIIDVESDCIVIEADDVFLNGDGNTITALEGQGGDGIFAEGYNRIGIHDITIDGFNNGVTLLNVQGPSEIVDSVFTNMIDHGIRGNGVTELTIRANLITAIQNDDIIHISRYYDDNEDEWITNSDITITENIISEANDSVGINLRWTSEAVITDNNISDVHSDGIYVRNGTDVTVSGNTIDNVGSDGIDFSHDEEHEDVNSNIVVTNNTLTNIGDHGIELDEVHGGVVTGNSIDTTTRNGIDVDESSDIVITNNTFTNIRQDGIELDGVSGATITGNSMQVRRKGIEVDDSGNIVASNNTITPDIVQGDDDSFTYDLPFTLDFFGRDIVAIEVNTNGSVELLEEEEDCEICDEPGSYEDYLDNDVIFASFDNLRTDTSFNDFVGVQYDEDNNRVVVEWFGSTYDDGDSEEYPLHFQVVIYANGDIQWNFNQMDFDDFDSYMFSGVWDDEAGELYIAGFEIAEQISYKANFSDESTTIFAQYDSEEVEGHQIPTTDFEFFVAEGDGTPVPIIGIDLDIVFSSSFINNSIRAEKWVRIQGEIEDVVFNNNNSGNTYYFSNGAGAWTQFDIIDTTGNGYADSGTDRPFNQEILGAKYWDGEGEDLYPRTQTKPTAAPQPRNNGNSGSVMNPVKTENTLTDKTVTQANFFTDTPSHWSKEYVDLLHDKCDVTGYSDDNGKLLQVFGPDNTITRAELVKIVIGCKYKDLPPIIEKPFPDVEIEEWFAPYLAYAKSLGWISGYSDNSFKPNSPITRVEALKIILLAHYADSEILGGDLFFNDADTNAWYAKYLAFAISKGIVSGYVNTNGTLTGEFGVSNAITRGETAKVVIKGLDLSR